jgi:peptidoglycan/xylan/chitin deacetylase (PgdA/CDA1 family)
VSERAFRVALTFDAEHPDRSWCPPDNAERIMDALAAQGVRATFFVQGRWALSQPALAERIAADGHLVGNHSHFHARMPMFRPEALVEDVEEARQAILQVTGVEPKPWFRFPFGEGAEDPGSLAALRTTGFRDVRWDVAVEDWEAWRTGPDISADVVSGALAHGDGAIVLLHTWPGGTGEAVPHIIEGLRTLGARFVGVDELGLET